MSYAGMSASFGGSRACYACYLTRNAPRWHLRCCFYMISIASWIDSIIRRVSRSCQAHEAQHLRCARRELCMN